MSFWSTSTGENAADNAVTNFETPGGNNEVIPEGTTLLAFVKKVEWANAPIKDNGEGGEEYVNVQWSVMQPEDFANRVVFHKLWVTDLDKSTKDKSGRYDEEKAKKKRDRNLNMFATIDANAGGRLARINSKPTNEELAAALTGKTMVIGLGIWETNDGKSGNWVRSVSDKSAELKVGTAKPVQKSQSNGTTSSRIDDEIPF